MTRTGSGVPVEGARPSGTSAAIFDLDRTMRASITLALLNRSIGSTNRAENLAALAANQLTRPVRRWSGIGDADIPQGAVLEMLAGHTEADVEQWARTIATTEILPRVHPQVVEIIAGHRTGGSPTVLVSVAPRQLASAVAATLDIDHVLATEPERDEHGRFTGHADGLPLIAATKLAAVEELARREGYDLGRSHVYSDRSGSPQLLAAAGFKHVVNPNREMRERALDEGWAIHEIRPVHWLWALEVPGAAPLATGVAGFVAGWAVRARRARPPH